MCEQLLDVGLILRRNNKLSNGNKLCLHLHSPIANKLPMWNNDTFKKSTVRPVVKTKENTRSCKIAKKLDTLILMANFA